MADYDRGTGSAGTLKIRDTGSSVEFYLGCSDPQTFSGGIPWSGTVNSVNVGGSVGFPRGAGWVLVAAYGVSTSQTVAFNIGASGTSGIGGPTNHSAYINRTPPATVPGAPAGIVVSAITRDSFRVTYTRGAANGAAITQDHAEWSRVSDGVVVWDDAPFGVGPAGSPQGVSEPSGVGLKLDPGTEYRVRIRSQNSAGWGPWSTYVTGRTLAAAYIGKAGAYPPAAAVNVGKASAFVAAAEVRVGKSGSYVSAA